MQIRESGKKFIFVRNIYNPEIRRGVALTVGTLVRGASSTDFEGRLETKEGQAFTEKEIIEIKEFLQKKEENLADFSRKYAVKRLDKDISEASSAIEEGVELTEEQAVEIYVAMDKLAKQLKKLGFKKNEMLAKAKD